VPLRVLKEIFGFDSFRPGQEEAIRAVLEGRDTLAVMPTGGGKSLCYQVPALMQESLTVIVSPLISRSGSAPLWALARGALGGRAEGAHR
jgi:ATP-dependent DNA helicase RecQ